MSETETKRGERSANGVHPKKAVLLISCVAALLTVCCLLLTASKTESARSPFHGREYDRHEHQADGFVLRVTAFHERSSWFATNAPGAYFLYEIRHNGRETWDEFVEVRTSPTPIPRGNFQQINGRVSYFYLDCTFAITKDGGRNWLLQGGTDRPKIGVDRHAPILELEFEASGDGRVVLSEPQRAHLMSVRKTYLTDNFGETWRPAG